MMKIMMMMIMMMAINWNGNVSRKFEIKQGVKQGGLLSADLFKLYSNDTFETLNNTNVGGTIGDIIVCVPGCADDVAVQSNNPHDLQMLVNGFKLNSDTHRCIRQPQKSVVVKPEQRNSQTSSSSSSIKVHPSETRVLSNLCYTRVARDGKWCRLKTGYIQVKKRLCCLHGGFLEQQLVGL